MSLTCSALLCGRRQDCSIYTISVIFYLRILHLLLIIFALDAKFLFQGVPGCNGKADLS